MGGNANESDIDRRLNELKKLENDLDYESFGAANFKAAGPRSSQQPALSGDKLSGANPLNEPRPSQLHAPGIQSNAGPATGYPTTTQ